MKSPEQLATDELKREEFTLGGTPLSHERDALTLLQRVKRIAIAAVEADRAQRALAMDFPNGLGALRVTAEEGRS